MNLNSLSFSLSFLSIYTRSFPLNSSSVVQPEHVVGHGPGASNRSENKGLAELQRVGLSLGLSFFGRG